MDENRKENITDNSKKTSIDKKTWITIAAVSAVILAVSFVVAVIFVGSLNVDTSYATPDEAEIISTNDEGEPTTHKDGYMPTEPTEEATYPNGTRYTLVQDWDLLKSINNEIVGWITLPDTPINYPVVKHPGDGPGRQYYLHRYYDKSYDFAGTIFIDYRSAQGSNSRNVILHGHNMDNGSMFGALVKYGKYSGDLGYYKARPTLFYNTEQGNQQWIIFSVYKTNTLERHGDYFNYLMGTFESDAQFMNYVYNVKERSLFDVPVPINENDQIITLSTCSYEYSDFRTVVCARKVRPGENVSQYVNAATINKDVLWPDVYYSDHSSVKPNITTFKTELQNGNISWYDGSGNLEGSEWLTRTTGNKTYTITFINYDGSIISTQSVDYGKDAIPPADPVKPSTDKYDYVFKGWGLDYTNIDRNKTIAPIFERVEKTT